jgi:acetate---CoA ligase (ADP-forming)
MQPAATGTYMNLDGLLRPRKIAIVGASERPSIGRAIIESLRLFGFDGDVFPVNPKYPAVLGARCYASLSDLPAAPDVVAFCVGSDRVLEGIKLSADIGARAAVIYDAGFAERGADGKRLQAEISGICRDGGIALCGPNCMGVLSPHDLSTTYMQEVRGTKYLTGNVGLVSQSGSICIGLLADVRRYGFSHVISSGNEAVVSCARYIDALVDDPETRVIAAFLESVREPERFVAALDRAADRGKPVVVLKVGRSERSQRAIMTHTGGLAGEGRVFSEVLRTHRAIEVDDLDALSEVLAAAEGTRRPAGPRLGVVTASGGQAELILDVASAAGIDLPPLDPVIRRMAEDVVGPLTGDGNPLDAWGNGDFARNFPHALHCLDADPNCDAIVMCSDAADGNPMGRADRSIGYARILAEAAGKSKKPHYMMGMRPGVMQQEQIDLLRHHGIPVLGGARQGFGAVARLGMVATKRLPLVAKDTGPDLGRLLADRSDRPAIHEADAKLFLAGHKMPVAREVLVTGWEAARRAAADIGWPVALKIVSDQIPHKSEHGLVALSVKNESDLRAAHDRLMRAAEQVAPRVEIAGLLVQEMIDEGIETFVGVSRDPDFGLVIAAGLGGVGIEIFRDFALRLLPLAESDAEAMIANLKGYPLLCGVRAPQPYDIAAFAEVIKGVGALAWANREHLDEIDLNPVKVFAAPNGCRIVDALIVPKGTRKDSTR